MKVQMERGCRGSGSDRTQGIYNYTNNTNDLETKKEKVKRKCIKKRQNQIIEDLGT